MERMYNELTDRLEGLSAPTDTDDEIFEKHEVEELISEILATVSPFLKKQNLREMYDQDLTSVYANQVYHSIVEALLFKKMNFIGRYETLLEDGELEERRFFLNRTFDELLEDEEVECVIPHLAIEDLGENVFELILATQGLSYKRNNNRKKLFKSTEAIDEDDLIKFYTDTNQEYIFLQIDDDDELTYVFK